MILVKTETQGDRIYFECPGCGPYSLSGAAERALEGLLKKFPDGDSVLSHALYRMTKGKCDWPMLSSQQLEEILEGNDLPGHMQQLDNFLLWVADVTRDYGRSIKVIPQSWLSAIGAKDIYSFQFIVESAADAGFVSGGGHVSHEMALDGGLGNAFFINPLRLTFSGWSRVDEIKKGKTDTHQAFMAMKFGDPETDALFRDHFKAAVKATGFNLKRLDEEPRAGLIDDRLRVEIRQSRFLIADLSHGNPGAYWEAGYAEGLSKPVIYTCKKSVFDDEKNRPHFDTNHHLTVVWDPNNLGEAVEILKATIRATLPEDAKLSD